MRLLVRRLTKAEQLRLFGGGAVVHVAPHIAQNPGGGGVHLVAPHVRHVKAGVDAQVSENEATTWVRVNHDGIRYAWVWGTGSSRPYLDSAHRLVSGLSYEPSPGERRAALALARKAWDAWDDLPKAARKPGALANHPALVTHGGVQAVQTPVAAVPTDVVEGATPTPATTGASAQVVGGVVAGQSVDVARVDVATPKERKGEAMMPAEARGQVYYDLDTAAGEWEPADLEGFDEEGRGPIFAHPSDYKQVSTRWAVPGEEACQLCGTNIKNVFWLHNHGKKLSMAVGSTCVEKHGHVIAPDRLQAAVATTKLKVKPTEVRDVNALLHAGEHVGTAIARVRARNAAAGRFDKKYPTPTDEQRMWWEQRRGLVARISEERARDGRVTSSAFAILREPRFATEERPTAASYLASQVVQELNVPSGWERKRGVAAPAGWTEADDAMVEAMRATGETAPPTASQAEWVRRKSRVGLTYLTDIEKAPKYARLDEPLPVTHARVRSEALDAAELEARAEHHPDVERAARILEASRGTAALPSHDTAWLTERFKALPEKHRMRWAPAASGKAGYVEKERPREQAAAVLAHLSETVRAEPLQKAMPKGMRPGQPKPAPKPAPALPPSKHVHFTDPKTGEKRSGLVTGGGSKGITVVDHGTGLEHKVHHGHYVATAKPGGVGVSTGPSREPGPDYKSSHPGLNRYPGQDATDVQDAPAGAKHALSWKEGGKEVRGYSTAALRAHARGRFDTLHDMAGQLEELRSTLRAHMRGRAASESAVLATMAHLVDQGMPPGREKGDGKGAEHGVVTLLKKHVTVKGDAVSVDGHDVKDAQVAAIVKHLLTLPGPRLFQHDADGAPAAVGRKELDRYVGTHAGEGRGAADLERLSATRDYVQEADKGGPPPKGQRTETTVRQTARRVAEKRGTDEQALLDRHVDPTVVEAHRRGLTLSKAGKPAGDGAPSPDAHFAHFLGKVREADPYKFHAGEPK